MDYPEDFELMKNVYLNCKRNLHVGGIVKYLDNNPKIAGLNTHLSEEYWKRIGGANK
jgi:spore coat polysaccharide biosynthesis protein SpsF (cytidylyltransferase family)